MRSPRVTLASELERSARGRDGKCPPSYLIRSVRTRLRKELELAQEIVEVPITGKIISVAAKAGDAVQEGDTICVIEAMKMENPILAPVSGKITEVRVKEGQLVATGNVIAIIEY